MSLSELLAEHRKKAEAASINEGAWFTLGRARKDGYVDISGFHATDTIHMCANDPEVVLALVAVAEKALEAFGSNPSIWSETDPFELCQRETSEALAALEQVMSR